MARRPGACLVQPRMAIAATGLCLCGIADEPPRRGEAASRGPGSPPPSLTSAISDWASKVTSRAIFPSAAVTLPSAVARSMIRSRSVCQGSTGRARPSSSASSATTRGPSSPSEARVPAAPPNCTASRRELTAARPARASSMLVSQPAATRPKVTGTACWSSVRPIMIVDRCASASPATAAAAWARSASTTSMTRLASSMTAVSTMSWLVAPRCTAPAAVCGTRRTRARARAGTGFPVSAASSPSSPASKLAAWATSVTAAPEPAGVSPARSRARASPASASSMACSHATSLVSALPRAKTPPNSPRALGSSWSAISGIQSFLFPGGLHPPGPPWLSRHHDRPSLRPHPRDRGYRPHPTSAVRPDDLWSEI